MTLTPPSTVFYVPGTCPPVLFLRNDQDTLSPDSLYHSGDCKDAFRDGVQVKDRKWYLKTYRDTFVAKEAVDFLVDLDMASTREDAMQLAKEYDIYDI